MKRRIPKIPPTIKPGFAAARGPENGSFGSNVADFILNPTTSAMILTTRKEMEELGIAHLLLICSI
ncbi:MAG TPA: hypothetical protein VKL61_05425, partial [Candidatus Polarisedimenticolia bacterium]|nr:hypothetical protein [Candidatus Polarisedimenticolia bacterium]